MNGAGLVLSIASGPDLKLSRYRIFSMATRTADKVIMLCDRRMISQCQHPEFKVPTQTSNLLLMLFVGTSIVAIVIYAQTRGDVDGTKRRHHVFCSLISYFHQGHRDGKCFSNQNVLCSTPYDVVIYR